MSKQKIVSYAWLFDVDGVITHPEQKRITEPQILDEIIKRLQKGEPVALVTGRSLSWMIERVIDPLERKVSDKSLLQNFFGVGEKGGAWVTFVDGKRQEFVDKDISVPLDLQDDVRKIVETEFGDLMFYDDSKKTMISVEMKDGVTVSQFGPHQQRLSERLRELLGRRHLTKNLRIDPTRIATDIENKNVGKAFGALKVLEWLKTHHLRPQQFIAFGDSLSDLEIAREIHQQGWPVDFVFVGPEEIEIQNLPFSVVTTGNPLEKGTLEYLSTH